MKESDKSLIWKNNLCRYPHGDGVNCPPSECGLYLFNTFLFKRTVMEGRERVEE